MRTHRKTCSAVCFAFQTASKPAVSIRHPSEDIMSLKIRLTEDMKTAMRAKDQVSLGTIRLINAAVKQFEVDERTEADDAKITAILTKMVKQRKDSVKIYTEAGRQDLADKENAEIEVLHRYLPQMLSAGEIRTAVDAAVAETGAAGMADMGKVMGVLKTRLAGKADMGEVNKILKAVLTA
ncbi:GatB/YqeY domain-containing protein [Neisseria meningitidis]|nr:GatB/YqeY domain-containing protein [Neisseria meningitidis]MBG8648587.1 GatB/YqeY domain-containing protein [Neisseria meningitidis]MBG8652772.1 GatB/YqeY domain-containing protein [Neisseria meningitidis]MBG8668853.1 GatB/YqeY domain-containing protein [Neisseria meningitidis]MBG8690119.1 GatB/YqeY domain-containing protein [Neisseria meningitidis]